MDAPRERRAFITGITGQDGSYLAELLAKGYEVYGIARLSPHLQHEAKVTRHAGPIFQPDCGFKPETPIEVGVKRFVEWYRQYYKISA